MAKKAKRKNFKNTKSDTKINDTEFSKELTKTDEKKLGNKNTSGAN